jgi:hypothetical protein
VDAVALASVISSAAVGLAGASVAFYSARRTAKTAQEGRVEQRAADGYLKVLSLAEQEAQWLDANVLTSESVRATHTRWREAADALGEQIKGVELGMAMDGDPRAKVPEDWMKELTENLQPKERAARQVLAEAVATELGHRRQQPARRLSLRGSSILTGQPEVGAVRRA